MAPGLSIEQGLQWLDMDAMRTKKTAKNHSIIKSIDDRFSKKPKNGIKKNIVQEYFTYKKLVNFLHDLYDINEYAGKVKQLENSEILKKYFKEEGGYEAGESQQISEFREHLSQMDQAWWDNKISAMKKLIQKDSNSPAAFQAQRMLSYLSLVIYMGASQEFNNRDYKGASYFAGLYATVDPKTLSIVTWVHAWL